MGDKTNCIKTWQKYNGVSCMTLLSHTCTGFEYSQIIWPREKFYDGNAELELNVRNLSDAERTTMCFTCYCNIGLSGYLLTAVVRLIWLVHAVTASGRVRVWWSTHTRVPIRIVHCVFPRGRRAEVVLRGRYG